MRGSTNWKVTMRRTLGLLAVSLCLVTASSAQQYAPDVDREATDRLQELFFPPELVMRNQKMLELTPEQEQFILKEMQQAQAQFTELHWKLQREVEDLILLLKTDSADEGSVIEQFEKTIALENDVKRTRLRLALRIKNQLTGEQLRRLLEVRRRWSRRPRQTGQPPSPRP